MRCPPNASTQTLSMPIFLSGLLSLLISTPACNPIPHDHKRSQIELHGEHEGEAGACFVKRLVKKTATALVLRQYNPDSEFEIPLARVWVVYPILKQSELMGI